MTAADGQRLRGRRRNAADPLNLIRIMPAKGAKGVAATSPSNAFPENTMAASCWMIAINRQLSIIN